MTWTGWSLSSVMMKGGGGSLNVSLSERGCHSVLAVTVNQQILAAIKFGVSQNKVIWRLLNLASPSLCTV